MTSTATENKISLLTVFSYILSALLIVSTKTVYSQSEKFSRYITVFLFACILLGDLVAFFYLGKSQTDLRKGLQILGTEIVFISIFAVINLVRNTFDLSSAIQWFLFPFLCFPLIFFYIDRHRMLVLFTTLRKSIVFLFVLATALYLINIVITLPQNVVVSYNWGGPQTIGGIFGLQFLTQGSTSFLGIVIPRNTAIFAEAPVSGFMLSVALLISVYLERRSLFDKVNLFIFFAIFTTTSSAALLVAVAVVATDFIAKRNSIITWIFTVLIIPIAFVVVDNILATKTQINSGSVSIRLEDITAGLTTWAKHPYIGWGLTNGDAYVQYLAFWRISSMSTGFSSGLLSIMITGGLYQLILYFIAPLVNFSRLGRQYMLMSAIFAIDLFMVITASSYMVLFITQIMFVAGGLLSNQKHALDSLN